jgi:hypothetical protein
MPAGCGERRHPLAALSDCQRAQRWHFVCRPVPGQQFRTEHTGHLLVIMPANLQCHRSGFLNYNELIERSVARGAKYRTSLGSLSA